MRILKPHTLLLAAGVFGVLLTTGCSDNQATATVASDNVCGVSELKANPDKYLGPLTLNGKAARVFPEDGVVEIADEKACCAVYLFVPFTEAQRAKLGAEDLYRGTLPTIGAQITADAELKKVEGRYMLKVKEIRTDETVLVAMM